MQKRKIYIVTGPIQTGKTTRLFNFIKDKNSVDGILAPVVNNKRALFHISTKQLKILEAENPGEKTITVGKYNFLKEVFDWANKKLLKSFNAKPEWLIIDEVGKLELKNEGLHTAIDEILNTKIKNEIKIILVIRDYLLEQVLAKYKINAKEYKLFEWK